jgi:hypothetical protein
MEAVAPRGQVGMLADYIDPGQNFVTCPNQDVVCGRGFFSLDEEPVVAQIAGATFLAAAVGSGVLAQDARAVGYALGLELPGRGRPPLLRRGSFALRTPPRSASPCRARSGAGRAGPTTCSSRRGAGRLTRGSMARLRRAQSRRGPPAHKGTPLWSRSR